MFVMHELPDMTQLRTYDIICTRPEREQVGLQTQPEYLNSSEALKFSFWLIDFMFYHLCQKNVFHTSSLDNFCTYKTDSINTEYS